MNINYVFENKDTKLKASQPKVFSLKIFLRKELKDTRKIIRKIGEEKAHRHPMVSSIRATP